MTAETFSYDEGIITNIKSQESWSWLLSFSQSLFKKNNRTHSGQHSRFHSAVMSNVFVSNTCHISENIFVTFVASVFEWLILRLEGFWKCDADISLYCLSHIHVSHIATSRSQLKLCGLKLVGNVISTSVGGKYSVYVWDDFRLECQQIANYTARIPLEFALFMAFHSTFIHCYLQSDKCVFFLAIRSF